LPKHPKTIVILLFPLLLFIFYLGWILTHIDNQNKKQPKNAGYIIYESPVEPELANKKQEITQQ